MFLNDFRISKKKGKGELQRGGSVAKERDIEIRNFPNYIRYCILQERNVGFLSITTNLNKILQQVSLKQYLWESDIVKSRGGHTHDAKNSIILKIF